MTIMAQRPNGAPTRRFLDLIPVEAVLDSLSPNPSPAASCWFCTCCPYVDCRDGMCCEGGCQCCARELA